MTRHLVNDVALAVVLYGGIALALFSVSRLITRRQGRRRSSRAWRDFVIRYDLAPPAACPDHPDTGLVPVGAPGNAMCPADGEMYRLEVGA